MMKLKIPAGWLSGMLLPMMAASQMSAQTPAAVAWPRPIPCRVQDGENPDVMVMTLGDVQTPLAQGTFDPARDEVTLKDGTVTKNFMKDVRGMKYFAPLDKTRFPLPPSGWCTWYYYYGSVSANEVKLNAKWIADNLKDYGAQYVQIDDGWQGTGRQGGGRDWTSVNQKFPEGMNGLAAYIKSLGLTPGLWLAPHGQSNPQVVSNNPNVFLLKANGTPDTDTGRWEGLYLVDPSTPESLKYFSDLFTKLSGWGFEYFKIDGQPGVAEEYRNKHDRLRHPTEDTDALYRKTLESIRGAIGPDRYLLGCWGTPVEGMGIYNGSRTGGDIVLGWGGFHVALRATLQYYFLHNIAWYGDPDVMLVRSPMTLDQARVWAALQGLTGQALMGTDRMVDLSEDRVELVRSVFPAADIRPLDLFPAERNKRIWDLKINHLGRNYDVVGVFNFSDSKAEQTELRWQDLGLPADKPVHVFDYWNKEYLGCWAGGMAVTAAPTSCRLLALVPADGGIQLVSTSRHVTQGWVDLTSLSRAASGDSYQGTSKVVKNDPYELRFAFPRGKSYAVKHATAHTAAGDLPVKIANHQGWATVELTSPKTEAVTWQVDFEPAEMFHYAIASPNNIAVKLNGLDSATVSWVEQYYLNSGYAVYLNGTLRGYSPGASYTLHGLDVNATNRVQVRCVWEDGRESNPDQRGADSVRFSVAALAPTELSLAQLEPLRSTAAWRGFEVDDSLAGNPLVIGGNRYNHGVPAVLDSEIEYDVKGIYDSFTLKAGLDDTASGNSSAVFSVIGDGKELWHSDAMKKSDGAKTATVKIAGVHKLVLKVVSAGAAGRGGRRNRDQADWAELQVAREAAVK